MKKSDIALSQSAVLATPDATLTFAQALTDDYCIIDVRSPSEYQDGSLPGAQNIPVFDNEERALVGTVYRFGGRTEAIDTGFNLIEPKVREFLESFEWCRGQKVAVFCARGGMRSRSVVNLLNQYGLTAWQLEGGYKQYRHMLLSIFEDFKPRCIVIHGHTGTGKTRILQHLEPMIDLEDLAQHQSSLFGGLNRQPRSQKNFDSHLHQTICRLEEEPYFIEGESRKMGEIYLPAGLAEAMKAGRLVLVTASLETRVARILEDYPVDDEATERKILSILKSLRSKLGHAVIEKLCTLLLQGNLAELVYILLVDYYDKRYNNSFKRYNFELELSSEDIGLAARQLTEFRNNLPDR